MNLKKSNIISRPLLATLFAVFSVGSDLKIVQEEICPIGTQGEYVRIGNRKDIGPSNGGRFGFASVIIDSECQFSHGTKSTLNSEGGLASIIDIDVDKDFPSLARSFAQSIKLRERVPDQVWKELKLKNDSLYSITIGGTTFEMYYRDQMIAEIYTAPQGEDGRAEIRTLMNK